VSAEWAPNPMSKRGWEQRCRAKKRLSSGECSSSYSN